MISKHLMLKFIAPPFPAPVGAPHISKHLMLKFIFYCLIQLNPLLVFQNILCWSLSFETEEQEEEKEISKHLMLKFIFRLIWQEIIFYIISKHLMLKFIDFSFLVRTQTCLFQNILCWSLSQYSQRRNQSFSISKHLMLKFINAYGDTGSNDRKISKHLMLKFIRS